LKRSVEHSIELYVLNPNLLSDSERSWVQSKITSDPSLEALANYYEDFYAEFKLSPAVVPSEITQEITPADPHHHPAESSDESATLYPSQMHLIPWCDQTTGAQPLVLAANSVAEGVQNVQTLYSEPDKTLVRILANYAAGRYELFMLSETLQEGALALLSVAGHDRQYRLVNGDMTTADFADNQLAETDWSEGYVRIPYKTVTVHASALLHDGQTDLMSWQVNQSKDAVHITLKQVRKHETQPSGGHPASFLVVKYQPGPHILVKALPMIKLLVSDLRQSEQISLNFFQ